MASVTLDTTGVERCLGRDALEELVAGSADVLARCQAGERRHANSLGWLDVDEWAGEGVLERTERAAERIRGRSDTFVVIGVGGSNNASRAVVRALEPDGCRMAWAGNTLSAYQLGRVLESLEGRDVTICCIAKNFETLEPGSSFRLLRQWLVGRLGATEAARRIVCCGTPGGALESLARGQGYEFVPFATDVGGRFTALTEVHLLPLAVAGVDIRELVDGAREQQRLCRETPAGDNQALRLAASRRLAWDRGYRVELLSFFEPRLAGFSAWWEQLFAESEGKGGRGIMPVAAEFSEQLHSLGQFIQDGPRICMETLLDVTGRGDRDVLTLGPSDVDDGFGYLDGKDFWDINRASLEATAAAHAGVLPLLRLSLPSLCARTMGELFYFFEFACYLSATLLGVDPFDQPGVEAYKRRMFRALGKPGSLAGLPALAESGGLPSAS